MSTRRWKKALLTAGLGTAMALGGVLIASTPAEARDNCSKRIRKEQRDLNRAIQRHGFFSWQANEQRRQLRWAQESCRNFNNRDDRRWWRDRDDRWHRDRDRDDRRWRHGDGDHDRDDRWRRDRDHNRDWDRDRDRWHRP